MYSPHLALRLKKSRAIPLLHLGAFMACYRVNFTIIIYMYLFLFSAAVKLLYYFPNIYYLHRKDANFELNGCKVSSAS